MKNFIVNFGRGLIDLNAWIILAIIVITAIVMLFSQPLLGIAVLLIGLMLFVSFYYLLYLFIDIRDLLKEIVDKNKENEVQ